MDDFLTSSSMDKHNEQLLNNLSAPVAAAPRPTMMAPPMAPPPQQYGMMAPPPAQPYGYSAPAAYGAWSEWFNPPHTLIPNPALSKFNAHSRNSPRS